jgi:8-oxo-dGTP pyrophosphatase MutT (NUDIX family)
MSRTPETGSWTATVYAGNGHPDGGFKRRPQARRTMPAPALPVRDPGTPAVRPKDAATLIIWRKPAASVEVLMGARHQRHTFMPERYVFPGGRVDPNDSRVRVAAPLASHVAGQLQRKLTPARAKAMAVAAVRETFEETGLVIGGPDPAPGTPPPAGWEKFFAAGFAPALDRIDYIARAVTPPIRPVRFNARFFMVEARYVTGDLSGSGELNDIRWFPLEEAQKLELPNITRRVLRHIGELVANPPPRTEAATVPCFHYIGGGQHKQFDE